MAFDICKTQLGKILGKELKAHKGIEVQIVSQVFYAKDKNLDVVWDLWDQSSTHRILHSSFIKETIHDLISELKEQVLNYGVTGGVVGEMSHLVLDAIFHHLGQLHVHVRGYQPLVGETYIPTPYEIG